MYGIKIGNSCGYKDKKTGNFLIVLCWLIGHRYTTYYAPHRYPVNANECRTCGKTETWIT